MLESPKELKIETKRYWVLPLEIPTSLSRVGLNICRAHKSPQVALMCGLGCEPLSQPILLVLCKQGKKVTWMCYLPLGLGPVTQALPLLPLRLSWEISEQSGPSAVRMAQA